MILRHQLAVLQRRQPHRPNLDWADRALLAALLAGIPKARRQALRLLVTPDTVLRWHRNIVRRRWAARSKRGRTGRPATRRNIKALVLRLARENPGWGYRWIRDRGSNYTAASGAVLADAGIRTVLCNVRTPRMNAIADRWIGGCRREFLDRTLIWNQARLRRILCQYETHHDQHRLHRSLNCAAPLKPLPEPVDLERYHVRPGAAAPRQIRAARPPGLAPGRATKRVPEAAATQPISHGQCRGYGSPPGRQSGRRLCPQHWRADDDRQLAGNRDLNSNGCDLRLYRCTPG